MHLIISMQVQMNFFFIRDLSLFINCWGGGGGLEDFGGDHLVFGQGNGGSFSYI